MSLIRKHVTPRLLAANRANSRKSTGPQTERGKRNASRNSAKHLVFANALPSSMMELGEDPAKYEKLRESLWTVFQPQDGFEQMLVEDMAEIRWRRRRVIRAEAGILVVNNRQLEEQEERYVGGRGKREVGLSGLPPSIPRFIKIMRYLWGLKDSIECEGFNQDKLIYLEIVYGDECGGQGRHLIDLFRRGCQEAQEAKDGTGTVAGEAEKSRRVFLDVLQEEMASFRKRAALLYTRQIKESNPFADSGARWARFRNYPGQDSEMKPVTIPILSRSLFGHLSEP
jgi:hypothetical protein